MKINVVGDSHANPLGYALEVLRDRDDVHTLSLPGRSTARVLAAIQEAPLRPADVTVVVLGGNDFGDQRAARAELVKQIKLDHGGKILWVGPALSKRADVERRHFQQSMDQGEQLPRLGVRWFDSRGVTSEGHGADGVHFTLTGYARWADAISEEIASMTRNWLPWVAIAGIFGVAVEVFRRTLRLRGK